jgi:uncharacterized protein YyaL (SSP411 family)
MANRLAAETSPYLLQHADNPVDWRAWGEDAWDEARERGVPVLVSIGYAACHWCHVMERESFEDPDVARLMNEHFVCIKVDREERPDVDAIYMDAVQAMTGQGGWPLNAFCTPDQVPFWAGTYFPPAPRPGYPSWPQVLDAIARAWAERREQIVTGAGRIVERLQGGARLRPSESPVEGALLDGAVEELRRRFDPVNGGWGGPPKFPAPPVIEFLLGHGETEMTLHTLRAMARGGIFDQVGGGFARYAVDATWTVPHFEKMLYDNGGLAKAYLHAWLVCGDDALRRVCEATLDWALREMRGPEGGFASSLDADSEGEEGRFYVWSLEELRGALGDRAGAAMAWFGASEGGNFEGANVLRADGPEPADADTIRASLLFARAERVRPGTDDKRLTSWNALMLGALAEAGAALDRPDYLDAATACASFLLGDLRDERGRLLRTWKDGRGHLLGYLEDHAYLLEALLSLYEATFDPRWFGEARALADTMIERFGDPEDGGFFSTASDAERLVARRKDLEDAPIPGHLLQAIAFHLGPVREVALVGDELDPLARVVRGRFRPRVVVAGGRQDGVPLLAGRDPVDGRAAAYVCQNFTCRRPVTEPAELAAALGD